MVLNPTARIKIPAAERRGIKPYGSNKNPRRRAEGIFVLPESCTSGLIPSVTPQSGGVLNPTARIKVLLLKIFQKCFFTIIFCILSAVVFAQDGDTQRSALIEYAKRFLGTPYKASGTTAKGMDCSGFLFTVVRDSQHITFPRTATAIFDHCEHIQNGIIEIGDLVFFRTTGSKRISHVGIYIGEGNFIHAASDGPKTGVIISNLSESYWQRTYAGARRFLPLPYNSEEHL
ncbi:MAG: hypothetical protein Ta2B_22070 [Termitinemataceae bacterium]|nr:MAG: hypothetical protein Ta2B_22070 [Termitinemataceae bacterium]